MKHRTNLALLALSLGTIFVGCGGTTIVIQQVVQGDAGAPAPGPGPANDAGGGPSADAGSLTTDAGSPGADAGSPSTDAGSPGADTGSPSTDAGTPVDAGTDAAFPRLPDGGYTYDAGALKCNRFVILQTYQEDPAGVGRILDTQTGLAWHQKESPPLLLPEAEAYARSKNSRLPRWIPEAVPMAERSGVCPGLWPYIPKIWDADSRFAYDLADGSGLGARIPRETIFVHN